MKKLGKNKLKIHWHNVFRTCIQNRNNQQNQNHKNYII
jgi:hypothetical protein